MMRLLILIPLLYLVCLTVYFSLRVDYLEKPLVRAQKGAEWLAVARLHDWFELRTNPPETIVLKSGGVTRKSYGFEVVTVTACNPRSHQCS